MAQPGSTYVRRGADGVRVLVIGWPPPDRPHVEVFGRWMDTGEEFVGTGADLARDFEHVKAGGGRLPAGLSTVQRAIDKAAVKQDAADGAEQP